MIILCKQQWQYKDAYNNSDNSQKNPTTHTMTLVTTTMRTTITVMITMRTAVAIMKTTTCTMTSSDNKNDG